MLLEKHQEDDKKGNNDATKALQKRIEKMKKKTDKIEAFLKTETPKMGKRRGENQSNITDNESAKIKSAKQSFKAIMASLAHPLLCGSSPSLDNGKVNIQWVLFCIVHNIGKIWAYIKQCERNLEDL